MNKQEILDEIAALKKQLNNLEKLYDSFNLPNKRWRAEKGNDYYFISTFDGAYLDREAATNSDDFHYAIGNYFRTKEQAEFEIERLKVIAELREFATPISDFDWNNCLDKKYYIILESDEVSVDSVDYYQASDLYFKSKDVAKCAIEAVGKERIIKYYFRREKR